MANNDQRAKDIYAMSIRAIQPTGELALQPTSPRGSKPCEKGPILVLCAQCDVLTSKRSASMHTTGPMGYPRHE